MSEQIKLLPHHRLALTIAINTACEFVSADMLEPLADTDLFQAAMKMAGLTQAQVLEVLAQADETELRFTRLTACVTPERSPLVQGLEVLEKFRMRATPHQQGLLKLHEHDEIIHYSQVPLKIAIKYTVMVRQSRTRDTYKQGIRTFWLNKQGNLMIQEFTPEQLNPASDQSGKLLNTQTFIKAGAALYRDLIEAHADAVWQKTNSGTQSGTRREQRPTRRVKS